MAQPQSNHGILDDAATCPAALNLGKTNVKKTRGLVEKLVETTSRPSVEGDRLLLQSPNVVSSALPGPLKIKSSSGRQRSDASVSAASVHSQASQSSYYSNDSGYSRSSSTMGSLFSINSGGTFDSLASYMPSRRTATWGPLLLGIVLFSLLTFQHTYMEPHDVDRRFYGDNYERHLIPKDANSKSSLLRSALLNPVYLKQDYNRRDDYGPVPAVASAFETLDEPQERKLLRNRDDKRIDREPCLEKDGVNFTSHGIEQANCTLQADAK